MAINIEHRWCYTCQRSVKSERHSVSHLFHLFLTAVTFGIWLIFWIILANSRRYKCSICGSATSKLPLGGAPVRDVAELQKNQRKQDHQNGWLIVGSLIVIPILVMICNGPAPPNADPATNAVTAEAEDLDDE